MVDCRQAASNQHAIDLFRLQNAQRIIEIRGAADLEAAVASNPVVFLRNRAGRGNTQDFRGHDSE
jgi:hypothetical protein